jgi:hypothetical protein
MKFKLAIGTAMTALALSALPVAAAPSGGAGLYFFATGKKVPGAASTLTRTASCVSMTLHTSGLKPGSAITIWWTFFNNPRLCHGDQLGPFPKTLRCGAADFKTAAVKASVQFATGGVADAHGRVAFSASFKVHAKPGCAGGKLPCSGLLTPNADVVLLVRSHGPVIKSLRTEETTTYNGGCNPGEPNVDKCDNLQFSPHEGPKKS